MKKIAIFLWCCLGFLPFNAIADSRCVVLLNSATGTVLSKTGDCETRHSPASTFKIPLAVMGYDAGLLVDQHNPAWEFREGYTVNKENDKQTTDPILWEKNSVVWYSQKLTQTLGMEKFQSYVDKFLYGNQDISGKDALIQAWLSSSLQISPLEQVAFLRKLLSRKLDVSSHAYDMTAAIMPQFDAEQWKVKGKTGLGFPVDAQGIVHKDTPFGWFVGWAERNGKTVVFASFRQFDTPPAGKAASWVVRDDFLVQLPTLIK